MAVFSAKTGKISSDGTNALKTVRNVRLSYVANNPRGHGSNTDQGQQFAVNGVKDWTGTFDFYGRKFPLAVGSSMTMVAHNGTQRATGTALVESIDMTCDIEGGGIIGGTVSIGGNSDLTFSSTTTALTDTSDPPEKYTSIGCKAAWGDNSASPSFTDLSEVRRWTLKYGCLLKARSSSSTGGGTRRVAGPFTGAEVSIDLYESEPSGLPFGPGDFGALQLYVDDTDSFEILYVVCDGIDVETDIEEGAPNPATARFSYTSHSLIAGVNTKGSITDPDGGTIW